MSIPKPQQVPQAADQASALDLIVKYAVVLTWLVYAAGLTKISGFLSTLGVPMDSDFFALPRVFSYGGFAFLEIVLGAAIGLLCMSLSDKKAPRVAEYAGWTLPILVVILTRPTQWGTGPLRLRLTCASWILIAIYALIVLIRKERLASREKQVGVALIFLVALTQGSGLAGDLEAHMAMAARPNIQILLPPEAVSGASKLGLTFSTLSALTRCTTSGFLSNLLRGSLDETA
jgi:hypothetical protein